MGRVSVLGTHVLAHRHGPNNVEGQIRSELVKWDWFSFLGYLIKEA